MGEELIRWCLPRLHSGNESAEKAPKPTVFSVFTADAGIVSSFLKLVEISGDASEAALFEKLYKKELYLRFFSCPEGRAPLPLFLDHSPENRIRIAADKLAAKFKETVDLQDIVALSGMSTPSFYRRFKAVMGMTPRIYVRNLRLAEAKRLMLEEDFGCREACFEVGYESVPYFNREFKNLFGDSPAEHIKKLRGCAV